MNIALETNFEEFIKIENLRLAFIRLQTANRNIYKEIYYEDLKNFGLFIEENLISLSNELSEEIYSPESSYKIYIPKKNDLVRPLSVLKFKDLLIYQAIINIISDSVYEEISPYYNTYIFANIYNNSKENEKDKIFFFKPWKKQWNIFEEKTKKYYNDGYKFLSEFDIASFFDTIDHYILEQLLINIYKIDKKLVKLLLTILESCTNDHGNKCFRSKHGIPQGPIASSFLADLYLFNLDLEVIKLINKNIDIKYLRYVDDIRIFSKDILNAKKLIAYLDLFARDLGLIPQASKICTNEVKNIDELLRHQKSKFSLIAKEYKRKNGQLKSKTNKQLKQRFLDCFVEGSDELYLDKTIIGFALYKLNQDNEIKAKIFEKWKDIHIHFEAILFYLSKHYYEDAETKEFLVNILLDDNILFNHIIALIFRFFPNIEFSDKIYRKHMLDDSRHWLTKYYMIPWLFQNLKHEIISAYKTDNYFISRQCNAYKINTIQDHTHKNNVLESLLKSNDCLVALSGLSLSSCFVNIDDTILNDCNPYIKYIYSKDLNNYINFILKERFSIQVSGNIFSQSSWTQIPVYEELNMSFRLFYQYQSIDPSKSLLNLNIFNELVYNRICEIFSYTRPAEDYGVNLNASIISDILPITNSCFLKINSFRNQRSEAHPYDRDGNLRIRITVYELTQLIKQQIKALDEICHCNQLDLQLD